MVAISQELVKDICKFYIERVRKRYLRASSELDQTLVPCIEHIHAGFDDLAKGLYQEKKPLAMDAYKHFKRAGIESMEFILKFKKGFVEQFIAECRDFKVQDIEIKNTMENLLAFLQEIIDVNE